MSICLGLIAVAVLSRHLLWACAGRRDEPVRFNVRSLCWVSSSIGQRPEVNSLQEFGGSFTSLSFAKYCKYIQDSGVKLCSSESTGYISINKVNS